jgi:hypothetical protein
MQHVREFSRCLASLEHSRWMVRRFFVRFICDEDGDIGVSFLGNVITVIKYKDTWITYWFRSYKDAGKYQGASLKLLARTKGNE